MERSAWRTGQQYCIILICMLIILFGSSIAFGKMLNTTEPLKNEIAIPDSGKSSLNKSTKALETEFTLATGIRSDDLKWSIAGNGIDVLSELAWSDVDSYQISMANHTQFKNNIYFRAQFDYALIQDGSLRDSDYGRNGRTLEWSRSISETTGDENWDFSTGGGYSFFFWQDRLTVSPLLGISVHKQNLRIQNGTQVLSETNPFGRPNPPDVGPLYGQLNSSYFTRWWGPWVGCDLQYKPKMRSSAHHAMEFRFSMELCWADYDAEGNWNLRGDLDHPKSFEHEADGFGISITAQWLMNLDAHWDITITASHQDWSTDSGIDRKFLASGGNSTTRLNEVEWESTSYMVGARYRF